MQLYHNILSSSLSSTVVNTNVSVGEVIWLGFLYLRPVNAALGSVVTVTVRWNDGQARSHSEVGILSSLGLFASGTFPIYQAGLTDITIEATLSGLGSCDVVFIGFPS